MKRMLCLVVLSIGVLLSGCGQQTNSAEKGVNEDVVVKNTVDEETSEETTGEGTEVLDTKTQYKELLAKYERTAYEKAQELDYVPRVGVTFGFQFDDTVTDVENLGHFSDGFDDGTYVMVHFADDVNNIFMYDKSKLEGKEFDWNNDDDQTAYYEMIAEQEEKSHQKNVDRLNAIPVAGQEGTFTKYSEIKEVVDTGIVYEYAHYYEIDNGYGLKNLVYVPAGYMPNLEYELYELGILTEEKYSNPTYNIQISTDIIKPSFCSAGVYTRWEYAIEAIGIIETLNIETDSWGTYLRFETYEFPNEVTEEQLNKVVEGKCEMDSQAVVQGTDEIGGKTYQRAEGKATYYNQYFWYRSEENKVYVIDCALSNPYSELLDVISNYSE